jgi:type IV pilus assembly protein PilW
MMYRHQSGMSLVELMVGILVGLLVVMAASGSLAFFEGQRRTSLSGNAAMNSGVMAGYMMQRDLRNAGLGLMNATQLGCTGLNLYYNNTTRADGAAVAPAQITDGGAGPDAVTVFFTDSVLGSAPVQLTHGLTAPGGNLRVNSTSGLQTGDVVLIASSVPTDPCTVAQISSITPVATEVELARAAGASRPWNAPNPAAAFANAPLYPAGGVVVKAGNTLTWRRYSVANGALNATDLVTGNAIQVAANVVSLQAQYGVTDGISNEVRRWVDATAEWANPTVDLITRIRAVRFSVVVRSDRKELVNDGAGNCVVTPVAPSPWPDVPALDLSADPDWHCFRYQVYASIAPLKNVVWSVSQ